MHACARVGVTCIFLTARTGLRELLLGYNRIVHDGDDEHAWLNWTELAVLDLGNNRLQRVPPSVVHMRVRCARRRAAGRGDGSIRQRSPPHTQTLQSLDLSNNDIASLPPELGLCTWLRVLWLHGNPQRTLRAAIANQATEAVLEALQKKLPVGCEMASAPACAAPTHACAQFRAATTTTTRALGDSRKSATARAGRSHRSRALADAHSCTY